MSNIVIIIVVTEMADLIMPVTYIRDIHAKFCVCRFPEQCPGLEFTAVAGPTHERHPPFQWSKTNLGDVPNFRTIDKFDFKPIRSTWTLNARSG